MTTDKYFNITSIGWGSELIGNMLDRVQERSKIRSTHMVLTDFDAHILNKKAYRSDISPIRKVRGDPLPSPDLDLLASLEITGVATKDSKTGYCCSPKPCVTVNQLLLSRDDKKLNS